MNKKNNYLLLSCIFLLVFLVLEFTDIYGNPQWFKFYTIILFSTFLISGLSIKKKK